MEPRLRINRKGRSHDLSTLSPVSEMYIKRQIGTAFRSLNIQSIGGSTPDHANTGGLVPNPFDSDSIDYRVLVNSEGQHSLWPAFRDIPIGWTPVGPTGKRQLCLDWIETNWTDMRPKSLADSVQ